MKLALIIGGGFAGCAMAHQLALAGGWTVTVVEAGPAPGAGVRTQWRGGHPFTFGPRHFLTKDPAIFEYLDTYLPMRRCNDHEFLTYVERDASFYTYPIHQCDIDGMGDYHRIQSELDKRKPVADATNFEEFWLNSVGPTLYDKFVDHYSRKMWQVDSNTRLDDFLWSPKGVTIKSGPRAGWDSAISAYPKGPDGYDPYFALAVADATVYLNTRMPLDFGSLSLECKKHDLVVSTISPDELFANRFGRLEFMGRDLTTLILPVEFALPPDVYFCYYAGQEPYTRVTEYKKFTQHRSDSTLITIEYPSRNGRLYPMPFKSEQIKAEKYFGLMPPNMFSIGRAGSYSYAIDIDDCIAQAMAVVHTLRSGGPHHPVPKGRAL